MGQFFEEIPEHLFEWILKQQMFWVASAPLSPQGHVNVSPKAIEGTFRIENSRRVWYEDLSGSTAETVSHIRENGRVTILFHAFEGSARIVRLYGKGFFHELGTPEYEALINSDSRLPGSRAVIGLDITKVGTNCGYAVPYYQFISHRRQLLDWAEKKEAVDHEDTVVPSDSLTRTMDEPGYAAHSTKIDPKGMRYWWQSHNIHSLDGLPAFSRDFGLGFPFVFSFGRLRASKVQTRVPHKRELKHRAHMLVPSEVTPETMSVAAAHLQAKAILEFYSGEVLSLLLGFLPFILIFIAGVLLGRLTERHPYIFKIR